MDYPVMLNIKDRYCVIFGGGQVATRKARELIKCQARLRVVSPELSKELFSIFEQGGLSWVRNVYQEKYLDGAWLCFACTGNEAVNKSIVEAAESRYILVNAADSNQSSFNLPAVRRAGELTLAVSANENPAASRYTAEHLIQSLEPWLLEYIQKAREIRNTCKRRVNNPQVRQDFMKSLFSKEYMDLASKDVAAAVIKATEALNQISEKEVWANERD